MVIKPKASKPISGNRLVAIVFIKLSLLDWLLYLPLNSMRLNNERQILFDRVLPFVILNCYKLVHPAQAFSHYLENLAGKIRRVLHQIVETPFVNGYDFA